MKRILFPLVLLSAFIVSAQNFPEIPSLESRDVIFRQYQQEVEQSQKELTRFDKATPFFYSYKAQKDDTVLRISARCSIWHETLATANSIEDSKAELEGKNIVLPTANGLFISELPQNPVEFLLANEYKNELADGSLESFVINGRIFYFLPGARFSPAERAYFLNPGMSMPLEKSILTSSFGKRQSPITGKWQFHKGIDLAAPLGTPVLACKNGTVRLIERGNRIYGNYIIIKHSGGMESTYAHLEEILVKEGSSVSTGQQIGNVGLTGLTTGPHLHFEIKQNGEPRNPDRYIK